MSGDLNWSDDYSVGVEEIDAQHKVLFGLLERLREAIHAKQGSVACGEILDELVAYTQEHFALEESLMREAGYPDLSVHEERHRELMVSVEAMRQKIDGGASISFELLHFLRNWLTKHILNEDKAYATHVVRLNFDRRAPLAAPAMMNASESAPPARKWWKFW